MEMVTLTGYAESGTPNQLIEKYGLAPANVADAARRAVARKAQLTGNGTAGR